MTAAELAIAMTIVGSLTAAVVRVASTEADRARVVAAEASVLEAYRLGQSLAAALGRPAEVLISSDSIVVRSVAGSDTVVVTRSPGPGSRGVSLSPVGHAARFAPTGLAIGAANVTHVFTRGAVTRRVVVSRLGRIRTT